MTALVNTVIIGAGQAGLALSYHLTRQGRGHAVLEQAAASGEAWRNHRWDSFVLNTPNWQSGLPGMPLRADDPDGFTSRDDYVRYLEDYARRFHLPVRHSQRVISVAPGARSGDSLLITARGETIGARNVVIATGRYQKPKIPAFSAEFPARIHQLHSDAYSNPRDLPAGAVLVVGSGQSGAQIAEELYEAGRKVYLCVSRAGRALRRYRGKDGNWWADRLGRYDRTVEGLASPKEKFASKPHVSGTRGGRTLNLHQFARDGVVLLGRLQAVRDGVLVLAADLHQNLAATDRFAAEFAQAVDAYVEQTEMTAPEEILPALRDGFRQPEIPALELGAAGITSVIWATGYEFDFSLVKLPIFDADGWPIQRRGVTGHHGLYFLGLPWLHNAKSGLIHGVGEDAAYIADQIAAAERTRASALEARLSRPVCAESLKGMLDRRIADQGKFGANKKSDGSADL